MSHQLTFADSEFSSKRRQTRKEIFLSRMEQILPWQNMVEVIEPFYPKAGNGRRPYPLETMLRIHCMQHWYNLSDGAMEDALYEIASMRLFARLSLDSALPDRTTIMNFRHLLEQHQLARQLFKTINRWLAEAGVMMTQGTLVDATIIEAPSSTKNKEQQRDPEMHQTKKGNQWHFGMKAHIGVDAKSGLTHSLVTTAANEHDLNQLGNLLHGEEQFVSADAGYQGAPQREELAEVDVKPTRPCPAWPGKAEPAATSFCSFRGPAGKGGDFSPPASSFPDFRQCIRHAADFSPGFQDHLPQNIPVKPATGRFIRYTQHIAGQPCASSRLRAWRQISAFSVSFMIHGLPESPPAGGDNISRFRVCCFSAGRGPD